MTNGIANIRLGSFHVVPIPSLPILSCMHLTMLNFLSLTSNRPATTHAIADMGLFFTTDSIIIILLLFLLNTWGYCWLMDVGLRNYIFHSPR